MKYLLPFSAMFAFAASAWLAPVPAAAQQAWNVPTITVFGTEKCPRDVICVRASESERFRIPKELRGDTGLAMAERWGDRAQALEYVGATGLQTCSPVGPAGATGCYREMLRVAREEQRDKGEAPTIPLDLP